MKPQGIRNTIGVRELKNQASAVLRRVQAGETVTITDRNRPIALLSRLAAAQPESTLRLLAATGRLSWSGGKPTGSPRRSPLRGRPVSEAVVEDRR